ncbi:unnamed protein product, partial [marine sediment metagenome]
MGRITIIGIAIASLIVLIILMPQIKILIEALVVAAEKMLGEGEKFPPFVSFIFNGLPIIFVVIGVGV